MKTLICKLEMWSNLIYIKVSMFHKVISYRMVARSIMSVFLRDEVWALIAHVLALKLKLVNLFKNFDIIYLSCISWHSLNWKIFLKLCLYELQRLLNDYSFNYVFVQYQYWYFQNNTDTLTILIPILSVSNMFKVTI